MIEKLSAILAEYKEGKINIYHVQGYTDYLCETGQMTREEQSQIIGKEGARNDY